MSTSGGAAPEWRGGEWDTTLSWFLTFVSTAQGREELLWGFEPGRSFFGNGFPQLIVDELGWILLIAGIAGIAALKRPLSHILYSTLGLYIVFAWAYRYGNWFQVILLPIRSSLWELTQPLSAYRTPQLRADLKLGRTYPAIACGDRAPETRRSSC